MCTYFLRSALAYPELFTTLIYMLGYILENMCGASIQKKIASVIMGICFILDALDC